MVIQTDIWSLVASLIGALLIGAAISWFFFRKSQKPLKIPEKGDREILFLVFSRIAHRLKTAMEIIYGHLYGFTDELPVDVKRWAAARKAIIEASTGLSQTVERMDLVVRLGMSEQPLVIEPVNVARLLEDLMVDLGPSADAKGIFLGGMVTKSAKDGNYVSGDVSALKEIFSNILENAIKHNGRGTEITSEVKPEQGNLLVRIADTGKGIRQEVFASLFDKKGPDYRPRTTRGTGMGLHLCKLLVELHGGQITASTAENKGTEFRILLPLRRMG